MNGWLVAGLEEVFAAIDGWRNTRRIQRELGYLSPAEYETVWHHQQDHTETANLAPTPTGAR